VRRRRRSLGWFEPAPKQPVPEDGLRVDRFGATWWGAQWIRALSRLGAAYSNRLPRGRSYARAGRVVDLAMGAGEVTAGVVGTRRRPYQVSIRLEPFSQEQWKRIVDLLAGQARFTVALLRGELPARAGEALEERGLGLFPTGRDMETSCSCPDWANPCKHVAAVHYVVAAALDMDPFLIFVLRGLGREPLLAALARARGMAAPSPQRPGGDSAPATPSWEEPGAMSEEAFLGLGLPRPQLAFRVTPAALDLAGLAPLGPPPPALEDLPRRLGPGIRRASRAAVTLAAAASPAAGASPRSARTGAPAAPSSPARRRSTGRRAPRSRSGKATDEPLTEAIFTVMTPPGRPYTLREIATLLDRPVDPALRAAMRTLRAEGKVTMVGNRRSARYVRNRRRPAR